MPLGLQRVRARLNRYTYGNCQYVFSPPPSPHPHPLQNILQKLIAGCMHNSSNTPRPATPPTFQPIFLSDHKTDMLMLMRIKMTQTLSESVKQIKSYAYKCTSSSFIWERPLGGTHPKTHHIPASPALRK